MSLLDSRLTLYFEKLFIPILEIGECIIDLKYEQDHYRFKYPMELPHVMPIKEPFSREKNTINLTILLRTGKKYKKIAKAQLNFYKKYFLTEKMTVDKWIHLELFETQLEEMGHNTNILKAVINTGKIFMKAQLIDSGLADELKPNIGKADNITIYSSSSHATAITNILKNNLKNLPNIKDKTNANKTEKFRSITENTNEFLRNLKNRKNNMEDLFEDIEEEDEKPVEEFNDGLSDISISDVDVTEKNHIEIDKMNLEIDILVNNVKNVFEERFNELVPKDPREIKFFIQNLSDLINQIASNYSSNLNAITQANKRIRAEAKEYYEKYKDLKRDFTNRRRELKAKNLELEERTKQNEEENLQVGKNLEDLKLELNFFKQLVGIDKDNDVILMANILDSLKNEVNIFEGLTQEQTDLVTEAIKNYVVKEQEEDGSAAAKENMVYLDDEDRISEDEMTRLVENEVNMVYGMDLIRVMDIKSVPNNFYLFDDIKVRLGAFKGVLYVLNFEGQDRIKLTEFIQEKFPKNPSIKLQINSVPSNNLSKSPQNPTKRVSNNNAQKPANLDALIDKKLAEKKQSLAQSNLPAIAKKTSITNNLNKK